ncbi:MAG TPA: MMPL family transporter, partial [Verrucomicrobiae bacterium]
MRRSRHWLWLLLLVPIAFGLARLRFDVEVLNLLPSDFPAVRGLKLYQTDFANARELILTVKSANAETTEAAVREIAQALRAATNLTTAATWQPLWLEDPGQSAELIAYLWLNQPPELFGQLTNRLETTNLPAILREARESLTTSLSPADIARRGYDPFNLTQLPESVTGAGAGFGEGQDLFASADGAFRVLFVQARPNITSYRACAAWLNEVKQLVEATLARGRPDADPVSVACTGRPAFVAEIALGMEHDMAGSVGATMVIIAALFWWAHRRLLALLWILTLLVLILFATMAFGALIFGTLSVISMGFASILLGLAVDYAVVHYQEALAQPNAIVPEIRRAIGPSIFWAAVTTISAFLVLNFSGLPGLGQLGSLVGLGICLSAVVMLYGFLPPLFRDRREKRLEQIAAGTWPVKAGARDGASAGPVAPLRRNLVFTGSGLLMLAAAVVLCSGLPRLDPTADPLRPQNSPAYAAVEEIKQRLRRTQEPTWILVEGKTEREVAQRLTVAESALRRAVSNELIGNFTLPSKLWPQAEAQTANHGTLAALVAQRELLRAAALASGFTTNSFVLTENILNTWQSALAGDGVFWPTNPASVWILDKVFARSPRQFLALGLVYPPANHA